MVFALADRTSARTGKIVAAVELAVGLVCPHHICLEGL